MSVYTRLKSDATERSAQNHSTHHGSLGRAAVFADFRPRDAKALDQDDFRDRLPRDQPVRLPDVPVAGADKVNRATDATAAPMADDKLDEELNDEIPW